MALTGKGFFIWKIKSCENGNPSAIASLAQSAGLTHVLIKIADGPNPFNIDTSRNVDLVPPVVQALHGLNIQVWGWHYIYGYNPAGEAQIAGQRVQNLGLDGYVIDAEVEFKQPGRAGIARTFMTELRRRLPDTPVAFSSFRFPTYHPQIPWKEFLENCDYNMPQVYWEQSHNPGAQLRRCVDEFARLSPSRPVIPTGSAYGTGSWAAKIIQNDRIAEQRSVRVDQAEMVSDEYEIPESWMIVAQDETSLTAGDVVASQGEATITATHAGRVRVEDRKVIVSYEQKESEEYDIPSTSRLLIKDGEHVEAGQALTEGSLNPHTILRIKGREACQLYLLSEIQKVYRSQGQNIHDKHFELVIRKMLGRIQVIRPGDTPYLPGDIVDRLEIRRVNDQLISEGKQPAKYIEVLLGVTKASLSTDSFLSASSFQHTIKVLAGAAIASTEDPLYGLKENVIIGKLIPAGTGYHHGRFTDEDGKERMTISTSVTNLPMSD